MRELIKKIGSNHNGFVTGMLLIVALAIGSLVMNFFPDNYPPFLKIHFDFFIEKPQLTHIWLPLVLLLFLAYGVILSCNLLNTVLSALEEKSLSKRSLGTLLVHLAVVLGLLAHLLEATFATSTNLRLTVDENDFPTGGKAQLLGVERIFYPDKTVRDIRGEVKLITPEGESEEHTVAYNEPLSRNLGMDTFLIKMGGVQIDKIVFTNMKTGEDDYVDRFGKKEIKTEAGELVKESMSFTRNGNVVIGVFYWRKPDKSTKNIMFQIDVTNKERYGIALGDIGLRVKDITSSQILLLSHNHNPGAPLLLLSLIAMLLGLFFWIYPFSEPGPEKS